MSVIGVFCEDIDFPFLGPIVANTNSSTFRSSRARCSITPANDGQYARSGPFQGGGVTSLWLSVYIFNNGNNVQTRQIGVTNSSIASSVLPGLYVGSSSSSFNKIAINKFDGSTVTTLAVETGTSIVQNGAPLRVDLQISNYGVSGVVNLYVSGSLVATYTGDISIAGITSFDSVTISHNSGFSSISAYCSEIIVADESTLGWQGVDLREITANGTTQQWSNPDISNFDPITINDANSTYSNTAGQDEQASLANSVSGNFAIKAVKIVARANAPAGSAVTNLKLGFRNGSGTVGVGTAHTLTTSFAAVSDLLTTDPTTGQPFTSIDGYQLDLQSA